MLYSSINRDSRADEEEGSFGARKSSATVAATSLLACGGKAPGRLSRGSYGGVEEVGGESAQLSRREGHALVVQRRPLEAGVGQLPVGGSLSSNVDGSSVGLADLLSVAPLVEGIRSVRLADVLLDPVDVFDELVVISPSDDGFLDSLAFDVAAAVPADPIFNGVVGNRVLHASQAVHGLSRRSPLKTSK